MCIEKKIRYTKQIKNQVKSNLTLMYGWKTGGECEDNTNRVKVRASIFKFEVEDLSWIKKIKESKSKISASKRNLHMPITHFN